MPYYPTQQELEIDRSAHRERKKEGKIMGMEKGLRILFTALLLLFSFLFSNNLMMPSCMGSLLNLSVSGAAGGCSSSSSGGEKVGECLLLEEGEGEEEGESRSKKERVLWDNAGGGGGGPYYNGGKRYISYDALRGDNVPCNRPGIPYYNCHALPKANPYTRGCSVITGCARGD